MKQMCKFWIFLLIFFLYRVFAAFDLSQKEKLGSKTGTRHNRVEQNLAV